MRRRARRGEGDRLRGEILEAADRLLQASGDEDAVSVRAVAREIGCTPGALYLHFPDRRHLLLAVCERHFADLDERVTAAVAGQDDPVEALRHGGAAYVRWGIENPEPYRMIFMTRRDDIAAGQTAFAHLVAVAQRAIDKGRIAERDPLLVATGLWSVVHGIASLAISSPHLSMVGLDAVLTHVIENYLAGLSSGARTMDV
jgi:AcrR family transcriptional regulator